jgi:hypothetical protein
MCYVDFTCTLFVLPAVGMGLGWIGLGGSDWAGVSLGERRLTVNHVSTTAIRSKKYT